MKEVEGWTPEKARRLERAWRRQMQRNIRGKPSDWVRFDNDRLPITFVGYRLAYLREKLQLD